MTNSIADIEQAECIFIIGSNTTENHPLIARRVMRAKERGARVIVADPRKIHIANFADLHVRQRPGTDVALLNGMMHVILREGLQDDAFIGSRTENFDAFKETIDRYPPEKAAEITGVAAEDIVRMARTYGQAQATSILYCMGITQHTTGVDNVLSCANLAMLTGNIGRPGTGVNPLRGQNNVQGCCDVGALANVLPGYQPVIDEAKRTGVEQVWGCAIPGRVGLTVTGMLDAAHAGTLKALYVMGENPMVSDPDINHVRESLEALDLLIVQDIFLTETAQLADVVLPAASFAEKDGTFTNTERRVQLVRKAIDPPGEARQDWEIVCQLAAKMGCRGFDFADPAAVFAEIRQVTPQYKGMSHERLGIEGLQWPCPAEDHPGTPILHGKNFTRGEGRLSAVEYKPPQEEPDGEYPFVLTTGRIAFHYHTGSMTRRSETLEGEAPESFVEVNPADAARLGIAHGETVRVYSRRGELRLKAVVTERVPVSTLFIPFHFAEAAANVLTNPVIDPVAKIPEYKVCAAAIGKA